VDRPAFDDHAAFAYKRTVRTPAPQTTVPLRLPRAPTEVFPLPTRRSCQKNPQMGGIFASPDRFQGSRERISAFKR